MKKSLTNLFSEFCSLCEEKKRKQNELITFSYIWHLIVHSLLLFIIEHSDDQQLLKGVWNEIFCFSFLLWIIYSQAPSYIIGAISIFYENLPDPGCLSQPLLVKTKATRNPYTVTKFFITATIPATFITSLPATSMAFNEGKKYKFNWVIFKHFFDILT